jgi:hypothetical protein
MSDGNLVRWIEEAAGGEHIGAVVIGEPPWDKDEVPRQVRGKALTWQRAKSMLDYDFHSGYGATGCNAVVAWTKSWVISVSEYDGSTTWFRIPRNPTDHMPEMPGGG